MALWHWSAAPWVQRSACGRISTGRPCGDCREQRANQARRLYGFPLTIFVRRQSYFPAVDWWSHDAGHLLEMMFGWRVNPHYGPFHIASFVLIGVGYWLISVAWTALHLSQRKHQLALTGIYARIRHPQYVGFILVMLDFCYNGRPF
jgi:hypothetical protein